MKGIYLVGGYPDRDRFLESVDAVIQCGFDFIEIGIPFNDPLADGPVIAQAINQAISNGVTADQVMSDIEGMGKGKIRKYIMTYANIIYSYGIETFSKRMRSHLKGVIIPDLPNRMTSLFYENNFDIPIVPFATLESRESDIELMNRSKSEIIYFVGLRGITGAAANFKSTEFTSKVEQLKKKIDKKIVIGFGIKTADDANQALKLGDGFVVGTEAVKRQSNPKELEEYIASLL